MLEDSLYLDNIQEFVQDENRIVTCKWLSRTLSVPVNAAKKMLFSYVAQQHANGVQLVVTYIVSGLASNEENCCHKVCLVEEDELEATKKQFSEVWGVHIYSVQKAKLKDLATLYAADFDTRRANLMDYSKWSTIDLKEFERLSLASKKKVSKLPSEAVQPMEVASKGTEMVSKATEVASKSTHRSVNPKPPRLSHMEPELPELPNLQPEGPKPGDQPAPTLTEANVKQVNKAVEPKKAPLKGSVASFFANVDKSKSSVGDKGSTGAGAEVTVAISKSPKKILQSEPALVAVSKTSPVKTQLKKPLKSPHKSPHKTMPKSPRKRGALSFITEPLEQKASPALVPQCLHDSDIESEDEDAVTMKSQAKASVVERPVPKKKLKKIKVKESPPEAEHTEEVVQRKRKRVQNMSSDEEERPLDDETPVQEETKVAANTEKKKKRVKRLVSKMYTTEDGSLVTERVMESFSEDECEPEPGTHTSPKRAPPSLPKTNQTNDSSVSKKGTKQASLTSFFK